MTQGDRGTRRILRAVRSHPRTSLVVVLIVVGLAATLVPLTRTGSTSFILAESQIETLPGGGVTVCVPGSAHVTIAWAATEPLPGFRLHVQPPGAGVAEYTGATGSVAFDTSGGSIYVSAENLSSPGGSVVVNMSWVQHQSLAQDFFTPQPICTAI